MIGPPRNTMWGGDEKNLHPAVTSCGWGAIRRIATHKGRHEWGATSGATGVYTSTRRRTPSRGGGHVRLGGGPRFARALPHCRPPRGQLGGRERKWEKANRRPTLKICMLFCPTGIGWTHSAVPPRAAGFMKNVFEILKPGCPRARRAPDHPVCLFCMQWQGHYQWADFKRR